MIDYCLMPSEQYFSSIQYKHKFIIYKKYYIYRNKWRNESTRSRTYFDCYWKSMDIWVGTKNLVFCSGYNVSYSFSKSTKEVISGQAAWHSPNMLPTMIHGQDFFIITRNPSMERDLPIHPLELAMQLCAFWAMEPSPIISGT